MVDLSLTAISKAVLVRLVYAINGIILTFIVYETVNEPRIFVVNALIIPSFIELVVTLNYKKRGEWTWFIPSVFIYLLWIVPCILTLEIHALNFRTFVIQEAQLETCPIEFYDECAERLNLNGSSNTLFGVNITDGRLMAESHDQSRSYSMLFQQIMMLIIIFGRWLAPKGKLSRDQLSLLLLALAAMAADMLEFFTESLSIPEVACQEVYVGFIITVWCWSLLQFPLGLTAVRSKSQVPEESPEMDSTDGQRKGTCCRRSSCFSCCCEGEIWSLVVNMLMQDGPYLVLRLYIIISAGYYGETLIFFAAKNAIVVMLQLYRLTSKLCESLQEPTTPGQDEIRDIEKGIENDGFEGSEDAGVEVVIENGDDNVGNEEEATGDDNLEESSDLVLQMDDGTDQLEGAKEETNAIKTENCITSEDKSMADNSL
ncbi:transmembrane protein 26-like [Diadema antillarum]|uniref:transmembrane protein 26-like n=1 Tax=Diadema antillarum TaxID=105358 RepID=UPI003A8BB5CA